MSSTVPMALDCATCERNTLGTIRGTFSTSEFEEEFGLRVERTSTLVECAQALRRHGNVAVHDLEAQVTRQDAHDLLDFTDAFLGYAIVLRGRFDAFRRRHQAAPPAPPSSP